LGFHIYPIIEPCLVFSNWTDRNHSCRTLLLDLDLSWTWLYVPVYSDFPDFTTSRPEMSGRGYIFSRRSHMMDQCFFLEFIIWCAVALWLQNCPFITGVH